MIGILSNKSKIQTYTNALLSFLRLSLDNKFIPIIIFCIFDIDFSNKTITGNLITKDNMEVSTIAIPSIIFNFSHHIKNSNNKSIRLLAEQSNVILLNEVNQFSQNMIMDMLTSCPQTNPLLLKYSIYDPENGSVENFKKSNVLFLPEKSFDLSKTWKEADMPGLFATNSNLSKKKWIIFDVPDLLSHNNRPVIIKLYAQRGISGTWQTLPGGEFPNDFCEYNSLIEKLNLAAVESARHINCFIPNLALCTAVFVLDRNFTPFLIKLDGWDSNTLLANEDFNFQHSLIKNLFGYYNFLKKEHKGGIGCVD